MTAPVDPHIASDDMRQRRIQLVATDLDGTFLRSDQSLSSRNRDAVHAAMAAGIEVVLATGRPPRWLPPVLDQLGLALTCVCANGAVVVDSGRSEITYLAGLTAESVLTTAAVLRTVIPDVGFAIETAPPADDVWSHTMTFAHDLEYQPRWVVPVSVPVGPLETLLSDRPVLKLLARSELQPGQMAVDELVAQARAALGESVEVTHSEQNRLLLEVSAPGIDKGSGLARVAAERGVPRANVAAVGDMLNDLPMLEWAGFAFAVENGHDAVKANGRLIPANDDDGVAQLLETITSLALDKQ